MSMGKHRECVRADLVGHLAVRRDPIGADGDHVDLAAGEERTRDRARDDGGRNTEAIEPHADRPAAAAHAAPRSW